MFFRHADRLPGNRDLRRRRLDAVDRLCRNPSHPPPPRSRQSLGSAAHRLAYAGLLLLGLALVGMTTIIFLAVSGRSAGVTAGAVALAGFTAFLVVVPLWMRVLPANGGGNPSAAKGK